MFALTERYYGIRRAATVRPPVEREFLTDPLEENEDYFLWVGRITEPHKQLFPGRRSLLRDEYETGGGRGRPRSWTDWRAMRPPTWSSSAGAD